MARLRAAIAAGAAPIHPALGDNLAFEHTIVTGDPDAAFAAADLVVEYPIVYCPFLWDGRLLFPEDERWVRFHDPADGHRMKLDIGSLQHEDHLATASWEAFSPNASSICETMPK